MDELFFVILPWFLLFCSIIGIVYSIKRKLTYVWGFLLCVIGISVYLFGFQVVGGFEGIGLSLLSALPFTIGLFILFISWIGKKM
ncbi:hypothetical protein NC661_10085 [Aquibacillus koreensis]|uniref:YesK-like protein n=1 Tax=Aquibacillus koreensis TaxID=279446 RepID=A0A9X3WIP7_9BACI|nr:hypothetical protein [Aquibacillus koreensis]MCT2534238.1 hypothetical protein [Aquibacillus koreensis]MDC3420717.1 hypothetical protein [Aquibacillus koreensis]